MDANRFEALEPVRQGVHRYFGAIAPGVARGLKLRHDHGSNYMSGDFQDEIECLGIEASPSFVREPEGNGGAYAALLANYLTPTHRDDPARGCAFASLGSDAARGGTLEKRWNDAMQRLLELEAELANFERQTLRTITAEQKRQILQLARDFPRLWTAPTTAAHDSKRMLRLLIRDITVVKGPEPKRLRLHIRWQGGTTETVELHLAPNRAKAVRYHDAFVARIRALAVMHDDDEIVALLNRDGLTSSTGKPFTISMIRWIRHKHRIPGPSLPTGTFSVSQVCLAGHG